MNEILQRFEVDFSFPVCFTRDLFAPGSTEFLRFITRLEPDRKHRLLFVIDSNVHSTHPGLVPAIEDYCTLHSDKMELVAEPEVVPGGEVVKNDWSHLFALVDRIQELGIDRQSFLVVVGGGALLDMACFAAAISHRGIRAVRVPTTVLSQSDSAMGTKNGMNRFGKKNFVGTFTTPFAVLVDFNFIETLGQRDRIAGVAEAVKVAVLRDRTFFEFLETNVAAICAGDPAVMEHQIRRSAELHLEHIRTCGDPFEYSTARPLDFGHWAAHKLESMTGHRLCHGEAVAVGMALDILYSVRSGYLSQETAERILRLLDNLGFVLWHDELLTRDPANDYSVLGGLREFQEHLGGALHVTLLRGIGSAFEVTRMDHALVADSIQGLTLRAAQRTADRPGASRYGDGRLRAQPLGS